MRVIILFLFSLILVSCKKEQTFTNGYSFDNYRSLNGWWRLDSTRFTIKSSESITNNFGYYFLSQDIHIVEGGELVWVSNGKDSILVKHGLIRDYYAIDSLTGPQHGIVELIERCDILNRINPTTFRIDRLNEFSQFNISYCTDSSLLFYQNYDQILQLEQSPIINFQPIKIEWFFRKINIENSILYCNNNNIGYGFSPHPLSHQLNIVNSKEFDGWSFFDTTYTPCDYSSVWTGSWEDNLIYP